MGLTIYKTKYMNSDKSDFSLYPHEGVETAIEEGHEIISEFISKMEKWQHKYISYGAIDTASRETFVITVCRQVGLDI